MKAVTRVIFLDDAGEKFFGEGPARLLRTVEETGSLRAAAMSMGMAYTKAMRILTHAEGVLGFGLTERSIGGKDGGGSRLTPAGKAWLRRYEQYRDACVQANRQLYQAYFSEPCAAPYGNLGCVIMASGLGERFGSNKLMADFRGEPLICRVLDATEGVFSRRVVVTRHETVAALCEEREIEVVRHDFSHRSDTIRLGLEAAGEVERCMFCPGDQPLLRKETVAELALAAQKDPEKIWRAAFEGTPGAPVVFPAWVFPELRSLPEGEGGGYVIKNHPEHVRTVAVRDSYELMDVDRPEDLQRLLGHEARLACEEEKK